VNIMIYCHICKSESIDFCSHMWLHWLLNIIFCSSFCVLLSFHKSFNQIVCLFVFNTTMQILWAQKYEYGVLFITHAREIFKSLVFDSLNKTPYSQYIGIYTLQSNGVLASGWDKAPLSYMIYSALFMPPFCKGGAVLSYTYYSGSAARFGSWLK
jgi:hypothetical protein